jgi:microcompartment protein CcmK/EutM
VVVLVEGGSARMIMNNANAPTNTVVAGIIDSLSINE